MKRFLMAAPLLLAAAACAHEEPRGGRVDKELLETFNEIRDAVGPVAGAPGEFAQALRQAASDPPRADSPSRNSGEFQPGPFGAREPFRDPLGPPDPVRRGPFLLGDPPRAPHPPDAPRPRPHDPHDLHHPHDQRDPKRLLQESAFELDQIAHRFEMAGLFSEADALRDAAGALRKSARKLAKGGSDESIIDPGPTGDRRPRLEWHDDRHDDRRGEQRGAFGEERNRGDNRD
ncbi:hypothetical protein [Botrimarina sp.]|uniref:hypothetical protein n=1 Tax=Botrimarina sp. TaxID=2795802 RepID=UPI0032EC4A4A